MSRGHQSNGREQFEPPKQIDTNRNWDMLRQYLDSIDSVLEELKPIVDKIAIQNTIIVMVCNVSIHLNSWSVQRNFCLESFLLQSAIILTNPLVVLHIIFTVWAK